MALSDQVEQAVKSYIGCVFTAVTATVYADGGHEFLLVDKRPIVSISSIIDTEPSTPTTTTSTLYDFYPDEGMIFLKSGENWSYGKRRKWKITVSHGYESIPEDVQLAIDTWVNHLTDNPSSTLKSYKTGDDSETYVDVKDMPGQVKSLLMPYKRKGL